MKCLEKDRTRRYETANGLAADLKRHLNSEPVVARPPSTAYRVQKFVRRNKAGVGGFLGRPIRGTIVHDDNRLDIFPDALDDVADHALFPIGRDDDTGLLFMA